MGGLDSGTFSVGRAADLLANQWRTTAEMQFLGGQDPGTFPSIAHVRRSMAFGHGKHTQRFLILPSEI